MNSKRGLSLIEIIVALGIFAIVSASITALMTSGLQLRKDSQKSLNAQQVAYAIIEQHKDYWAVVNNYEQKAGNTNIPDLSNVSYLANVGVDVARINLSYSCLNSSGIDRSNTTAPLFCQDTNPALRRVTVTVRDLNNVVTAQLSAEIGRPVVKKKDNP